MIKKSSPGRRGRPKSEEKREQIMRAAADLFLSEGFSRTSMDTIAAAAGVSKQTVYSHFRNKDELFRSCIAKKVRQYALVLDPAGHDTLEQGLASLADGYLRLLSDAHVVRMWRVVITEAVTQPKVAGLFYQTGPKTTVDSLTAFLAHHADRLKTDDFERAARTFMALVAEHYQTQIMLCRIKSVPASERARHARRSVEQFMKLFGR